MTHGAVAKITAPVVLCRDVTQMLCGCLGGKFRFRKVSHSEANFRSESQGKKRPKFQNLNDKEESGEGVWANEIL